MGKSRKEKQMSAMMFNPRASTAWSEDNAKFGQRMLEKMGWKRGQGLGTRCQGVTENIKLRLKLDSEGLGYKTSDQDQWLQVERSFSSVLSRLNEDRDATVTDSAPRRTQSLESTSMKSKNRVHYRKFTRGKDVSRYNEKDLVGILGQRIRRPTGEEVQLEREASFECDEKSVTEDVRDERISLPSKGKIECSEMSEVGNDNAKVESVSSVSALKKRKRKTTENQVHIGSDVAVEIGNTRLSGVTRPSSCRKRRRIAEGSVRREDTNSDDTFPEPTDVILDACPVQKKNSATLEESTAAGVQRDSFTPAEIPRRADESMLPGRKTTKVERIVEKKRLLEKLLNDQVDHEFVGSNLKTIGGYGSGE